MQEEISVPSRNFFAVLVLMLNAFTWYYVGYMILGEILDILGIVYWKEVMVWIIHYLIVAVSALLGGIISNRVVQRATLVVWWMVLGTVSSLTPLTFGGFTWMGSMFISVILAFSFGVGMPSCLAYFADFTSVENRGRFGGYFFCATYLGIFFFALILPQFNLATKVLFCSLWRLFGLFVFVKTRIQIEVKYVRQAKDVSYSYIRILKQKTILLYLIPWVIFSVINNLEIPILENLFGPDLGRSVGIIEFAFSSLFVLVGGFFADWVGRKHVAMAGFVALGVAYATLGFFPDMLIFQWFYSIIGAVAWGMFTTVFLMTIWGDLSQSTTREKYYAIGGMPFLLSGVIPLLAEPYSKEISVHAAFSLASFFLFLAVLPLMYAPETLPEKKIQLRKLRKYVEEAKKKAEKER